MAMQGALFQAYRMLESFDDSRPLKPWLFRIAHNRCIDFLRRRGVREEAETAATEPDRVMPAEPPGPALGRAVEHLVLALPPKERAAVLLKDVFDYSLEEIAEMVDSTVGGVKAALHRGRAKLPGSPEREAARERTTEEARLLHLYVDRFNQQDWDGLRELIAADARLRVMDRFAGAMAESSYFGNYSRWPIPWRLEAGEVDGEPVVIILFNRDGGGWKPESAVRLEIVDQRVTRVADYIHCPWILQTAAVVTVGRSSSN
jgi:RNA polymerase sigma-70 factor (ECF subfamily)